MRVPASARLVSVALKTATLRDREHVRMLSSDRFNRALRNAVILAIVACLNAFTLQAQDNPPRTCTLSGTVVSSQTGEPVARVELLAEPGIAGPSAPASTISDSYGNLLS